GGGEGWGAALAGPVAVASPPAAPARRIPRPAAAGDGARPAAQRLWVRLPGACAAAPARAPRRRRTRCRRGRTPGFAAARERRRPPGRGAAGAGAPASRAPPPRGPPPDPPPP